MFWVGNFFCSGGLRDVFFELEVNLEEKKKEEEEGVRRIEEFVFYFLELKLGED